jgi:dihydroorotate dehydrogenase (NAD+) catalytic subunit
MVAGAAAVQVGTANFINPLATSEIVQGMRQYVKHHKLKNITEIVGTLKV